MTDQQTKLAEFVGGPAWEHHEHKSIHGSILDVELPDPRNDANDCLQVIRKITELWRARKLAHTWDETVSIMLLDVLNENYGHACDLAEKVIDEN